MEVKATQKDLLPRSTRTARGEMGQICSEQGWREAGGAWGCTPAFLLQGPRSSQYVQSVEFLYLRKGDIKASLLARMTLAPTRAL